MSGYLASKKSGSVMVKQCSSYKEQVAKNRTYIGMLIDIILFLGKQGIAHRGHRENADSLNQGTYYINFILHCLHLYSITFLSSFLYYYK